MMPPKEFVRISHYGTGKSLKSPVMLQLPKAIDEARTRVPVRLEFALAFREAYLNVDNASDLQELRSNVREMTVRIESGQIYALDAWPKDLMRMWRHKNWIGYFDEPARRSAEDKTFDELGYLAMLAEFDQSAGDSYYNTWMSETRLPRARRIVQDTALLAGLGTGAASVAMTASEPMSALWFGFGLVFLRFSTRFDKLVTPTFLRYYAREALEGQPEAQKDLVRKMAKGMSHEDIVRYVADALTRVKLKAESERLAQVITDELFTREAELDQAEAALVQAPALAVLIQRDDVDPDREVLEAQRALLTELRARAASLQA